LGHLDGTASRAEGEQRLRAARQAAKRHQAVSGYWHTQQTLARWCRIRAYLDSAAAGGLTAPDAITAALAGNPWLPAVPAAA
jgi:transposase